VQIHKPVPEGAEKRQRAGRSIHKLSAGPLCLHRALQEQAPVLAWFGSSLLEGARNPRVIHSLEDGLDGARRGSRTHQRPVGPFPEQQPQSAKDDAFSRAGFSGDDRKSVTGFPEEILDEGEVANLEGGERCGHGGKYASVTGQSKDMQALEITFLGTGTSHGIPVIGCPCRVCSSADPRDKRLRTSTLLRDGSTGILIDTPPDLRLQCLRENITRIDAVIHTHSHADHILGFDDLRRFCEIENKSMPVHATPATLADLRRVFQYAFNGSHQFRNYVRPSPVPIEGPFDLGGLRITPVELPHGRMVTTGLVFSRGDRKLLAYYTDCQAVPLAAVAVARGADVLVLDALRHAPHTTHLSFDDAVEAAETIGAKRTYFIHMCHDLGHAETEARLPENIRLAYDGLRLSI